ncbi:MAG TPA: transcription repressor NadR [Bacillota bacterium]|nr:transcription repressor NadR [Bacillota bacterium]
MKDWNERQKRLLNELILANGALSGAELAERFNVTRQVVVHDIALLRATGYPIVSTPRGYRYLAKEAIQTKKQHILSIYHPPELAGLELQTLVDFGFHIKDVFVDHPLYGELRGSLLLSSRRDVELFLQQSLGVKGSLLSGLTDGYHFHTIEAESMDYLPEVIEALKQKGIQVFE